MKTAYIAPSLLVGYAIYSVFAQISIAHSIILFSLAGLFAYTQYLSYCQENTKTQETLAKAVNEFKAELEKHKETNDKKLSDLEGEITKMSLNVIKSPPSSPSSSPGQKKPQYQF